jgi:aldose sugar dehydrogenase
MRGQILKRKVFLLTIIVLPIVSLGILFSFPFPHFSDLGQHSSIIQNSKGTFKAELFAEGLSHPTSMAFVDNATILVLEKDGGNIRKISDGVLEEDPVLQLNINSTGERGLLGIAVLKNGTQGSADNKTKLDNDDNKSSDTSIKSVTNLTSNTILPARSSSLPSYCSCSVFIYFTQKNEDTVAAGTGAADNLSNNNSDSSILKNVIYEYDWNSKSLINPRLLIDLPAEPGPYHDGGKLKVGPDNQLYAVIGDLTSPNGILQNHQLIDNNENNNMSMMSNSSVIIRIDPQDGFPSKDNPFLKDHQNGSEVQMRSGEGGDAEGGLGYYYAYGIRNSFGLAFDPVTKKLWDTENGEKEYDEINIVNPGFDSGWHKVMGPKSRNGNISNFDLVLLKGAHYSDPVFSWKTAIGVTDMEFFNSSKFGNEYKNNLFVGDINNGNLYFFKVNSTRTGVEVSGYKGSLNSANSSNNKNGSNNEYDRPPNTINNPLSDLVADNPDESASLIFAKGFKGRITDIETGPDGYLYVLTYNDGRIYRITNNNSNIDSTSPWPPIIR